MTNPQSPAMVEVDRLPDLKGSPFESPMAQALQAAFIDGWGACRDAEFCGDDAMNDGFNQSATLGLCISIDQSPRADTIAQLAAERAEVVRLREALEEIALAGMSPSPEMSQNGVEAWHARRAWEFIRIAARAISPAALATTTQGVQS